MLGGYLETGLDKRSASLGAVVGAVSMLGSSVALGGVTSQWSIIMLVALAGIVVSIPAGIVTGMMSTRAERELQHGGFAGLLGTVLGLVLVGTVETAFAPGPTVGHKLDILYLTLNWGLFTLVWVFPFIFLSGGYLARYVANLRWEMRNEDTDWEETEQFKDFGE